MSVTSHASEGEDRHPAGQLPRDELVDYMVAVASMAAAGGKVHAEQIDGLRVSCKALELADRDVDRVIAAAAKPDEAQVEEVLARLKKSDLRFTLLTDLIILALVDGKYARAEREYAAQVARSLDIAEAQLAVFEKYADAAHRAAGAGSSSGLDFKKLGGDVSASIVSVGVPIAAVAAAGSVSGLSAAGVTSGLAALGAGMGMVPGLGVAVAAGVGSYFAFRWVYAKATKEKR